MRCATVLAAFAAVANAGCMGDVGSGELSVQGVDGQSEAVLVCLTPPPSSRSNPPSPSASASPTTLPSPSCGPFCEGEYAGGIETTGCIDSVRNIWRRYRQPIPNMSNYEKCIEKLAAWKREPGTLTIETLACTALSGGASAAKLRCENGRLSQICLNMMAEPYVKICLAGMESACTGLGLTFG